MILLFTEVAVFRDDIPVQAVVQTQPGAAAVTLPVTCAQIQHMAAVLLRQDIAKYWPREDGEQDETGEVFTAIAPQHKALVRERLVRGLSRPHISTAISSCIAEIASHDYPDQWPELMDGLLGMFQRADPTSPDARSSMNCLAMIAESITESQLFLLFPKLAPYVLQIASTDQNNRFPLTVRTSALRVLFELMKLLTMVKETHSSQANRLLQPVLVDMLQTLLAIIGTPNPSLSAEANAVKMNAIKIVKKLIEFFQADVKPHLPTILQNIWRTMSVEYAIYEREFVYTEDSSSEEAFDFEGSSISFPTYVNQLVELMSSIVGKKKFRAEVQPALASLAYHMIGMAQLTAEDIEVWSDNPNQFVADEEEEAEQQFSVRNAASCVLDSMIHNFGDDGIKITLQAFGQRIQESAAMMQSVNAFWWKKREAALFVLGNLSYDIIDLLSEEPQAFNLTQFLQQLYMTDLKSENFPIYLKGRVILTLGKFLQHQSPEMIQALMLVCSQAISQLQGQLAVPVKVFAARSTYRILEAGLRKQEIKQCVQQHVDGLIAPLCQMHSLLNDDTMHVMLELLALISKFKPEAVSSVNRDVTQVLLLLLNKFYTDPILPSDILNVFECMSKAHANVALLKNEVMPQISRFLTSQQTFQQYELLDHLIELLSIIVSNAQPVDVPDLVRGCYIPIAELMLNNDDAQVLQSGCDCMRAYIHAGGTGLAQVMVPFRGQNVSAVQVLLQITQKLLSPALPDQAIIYIGPMLSEIIANLGSVLGDKVISEILQATVNRLASAENLTLVQSLVLVFAKLMHTHLGQMIDFLSQYQQGKALEALLLKWSENQKFFFGSYRLKLSVLALVKMLQSGDARLAQVSIPVEIEKPTTSKYRTRSTASIQKQLIPFPVRAMTLIAESYSQAMEAAKRRGRDADDLQDLLYGDNSDDEGDFDDDDFGSDGEDDDAFISRMQSKFANGGAGDARGASAELNKILGEEAEDDDEEDDVEDPFAKYDPLNNVNLQEALAQSILQLAKQYPQLLQSAAGLLTDDVRQQVQKLFTPAKVK